MKTQKKLIFLISTIFLIAVTAILLDRFIFSSRNIAYGCFHQVAHKGSGCAALVQKRDGQIVLQLIDFKTAASRDLQIWLISAADARENETVKNSDKIFIAPLRAGEGFQEYVVTNAENLAKFNAVTIWNNKYSVNFTTAPLVRGSEVFNLNE